MNNIKNKWVWITGASSGLGEAMAVEFARQGARLVLSSRRKEELERVKDKCVGSPEVIIETMDVIEHDEMPKKVERVLGLTGHVDILINSAGISQRSLVKDTDFEVDKRIIDINFLGTVAISKAILPHFIERNSGQFVAISSVTGKLGTPLRSSYAASKHALHGFFDSLRAEMHDTGIDVTLICPGYIKTNISINAVTGDGSPQNKMDEKQAKGMLPDTFASKAVRGIARKRREMYIGGTETLGIYIKRFFPGLLAKIITRVNVT
ncbi:MAG TPA: SDR family oxidoreductase [Saprospiraceae bacterium]|nr:SDR family oxidoreductase [Saprospiraceae bacterium]